MNLLSISFLLWFPGGFFTTHLTQINHEKDSLYAGCATPVYIIYLL